MASALRKAQSRVRPRYQRDIAAKRAESEALDRQLGREKRSIRGAGGAIQDFIGQAIAGAGAMGLEGKYKRQFVEGMQAQMAAQDVGVSDQIAAVRQDTRSQQADIASAIESLASQRQDAVRTEAGQIRKARATRREEAKDKAQAANKKERQHAQAVRDAIGEIRAAVDEEGKAYGPLSPVGNPISFALGIQKEGTAEVRRRLRHSPKVRRQLLQHLVNNGNAKNMNIAETALEVYLARRGHRTKTNPVAHPISSVLELLAP